MTHPSFNAIHASTDAAMENGKWWQPTHPEFNTPKTWGENVTGARPQQQPLSTFPSRKMA
jgi:hypothetical protein